MNMWLDSVFSCLSKDTKFVIVFVFGIYLFFDERRAKRGKIRLYCLTFHGEYKRGSNRKDRQNGCIML